jgi:apolipoprotein N-acyltransferase
VIAVGAVLAYGRTRLRESFTTGAPVAVALVQGGVGTRGSGVAEFERYLSLSRTEAAGADLVVWPEHAITFPLLEPGARRTALLEASRELGAELIVGGLASAQGSRRVRQYNSAFLIRDGRLAGRYDKVRLLPVAEASLLPRELRAGQDLVPGRGLRLLRTRAGRVAAFICVESMYPEAVRALGRDAGLLVNLSNDAWFAHETPAAQQLAIASLRAIENRRPLLRATATGISAIVDPHGRIVARSGFGTGEVLRGSVRMGRGTTVYQRWGDALGWAVVGTTLAWSLVVVLVNRPAHRRATNAP